VSRTLFWNLFKYMLALGLLGYVVYANWQPGSDSGLAHVWNKHAVNGEPIQGGYLGLALLLICCSTALTLVRWYFLVRAQGLPFHLKDAFRLGLIGLFFSTFLPGSVGGDVVKAAGIARGQKRRTAAVATVLMDRVIAVWAMVGMVAILGWIFWSAGILEGASATAAMRIVRAAWVITGGSVVVWVLLGFLPQRRADKFAGRLTRLPKVGHAAAEFWRAVWMYRCRQGSVYLALLLTWLGQIGFVLGFYFSAMTLYDPASGSIPTVPEHFLLVPVGLIIQAIPLFPGGAGIGEAGFGGLYAWFGSAAAIAVLGSLMMRMVIWVIALGGFVVAQRMQPHTVREPEPAASEEEPLLRSTCESPAA
jgi:glycosyltransferase 2 family protein